MRVRIDDKVGMTGEVISAIGAAWQPYYDLRKLFGKEKALIIPWHLKRLYQRAAITSSHRQPLHQAAFEYLDQKQVSARGCDQEKEKGGWQRGESQP